MEDRPSSEPIPPFDITDAFRAYLTTKLFVSESIPIEIADGYGRIRQLRIPKQAIAESGIDFDSDEEDIDLEVFANLFSQAIYPDEN